MQGERTNVVHARSCPGVGSAGASACAPGSARAARYALRGRVALNQLPLQVDDGIHRTAGSVGGHGTPPNTPETHATPLADPYLTFWLEEQKCSRVPVDQADPSLTHTLERLLGSLRTYEGRAVALFS